MKKKLLLSVAVVLLLVFVVAGSVVYAQEGTPPAQGTNPAPAAGTAAPAAKTPKAQALARFGIPGVGWKAFDAAADALKLTPTQLFERLHSGETLPQIAQAQGVNLQTVQQAVTTVRQDAAAQAVSKAVQSGRITQSRGDWLLQGLKNGWLGSAFKALLRARLR
jgi:hypothetical protein